MLKSFLSTATILFLSSFAAVSAQSKNGSGPRFLDDIVIEVAPTTTVAGSATKTRTEPVQVSRKESSSANYAFASIESADKLQFKYSLLLDTEVEVLLNLSLIRLVDDWMGTRYKMGGNSKTGIDCSALMQVLFTSLYGLALPRTAREQYAVSSKISREELKEGDLIFFNTTGGVSHVGMYLQNNKFVHAGTSTGVTISDLDEEYWVKRLVSFGRIEEGSLSLSSKP